MKPKVTKLGTLRTMAWLTVSMVGFTIGTVVYALVFEKPYLSYHNLPFPTAVPIIVAGQPTPLVVERCNSTKKTQIYDTTRRLVHFPGEGEVRIEDAILQSEPVSIKPGCHRSISKLSTPPLDTKKGTYAWAGVARVKGLMRTHEIEWYSEPFEIVAPESKK